MSERTLHLHITSHVPRLRKWTVLTWGHLAAAVSNISPRAAAWLVHHAPRLHVAAIADGSPLATYRLRMVLDGDVITLRN